MKKFISGFIIGAMLFSMLGVYATITYVAKPLDYKVVVNGEDFTSDPPPVEIEGRTYLPLRAVGDALGVPVNWNEELRQAEVGFVISDTQTQYATYTENNSVIDFGTFCKIKPCKDKIVSDDMITYIYDFDDVTDEQTIEYLAEMEKLGYNIKQLDKTPRSTFGGFNENNNFFALTLYISAEDIKTYVLIQMSK